MLGYFMIDKLVHLKCKFCLFSWIRNEILFWANKLYLFIIFCTCDIQSLKPSNFLKVFLAPLIENGIPFKYVLSWKVKENIFYWTISYTLIFFLHNTAFLCARNKMQQSNQLVFWDEGDCFIASNHQTSVTICTCIYVLTRIVYTWTMCVVGLWNLCIFSVVMRRCKLRNLVRTLCTYFQLRNVTKRAHFHQCIESWACRGHTRALLYLDWDSR